MPLAMILILSSARERAFVEGRRGGLAATAARTQPTEKELPQPQDEAALGLRTWK
jgi:hypothetical protein